MSSLAAAMSGISWELGAVAVGVAVLVAAVAAAIQSWVSPPSVGVTGLLDRGTSHSDSPTIRLGGLEATKAGAWLSRVLGPLVVLVRPTRSDELSQLRSRLIQAGLRSKHAMEAFLASKVVLAATATLSFLEINSRQSDGLGFPVVGGVALVVCAAAFFVPNLWLSSVTKQRKIRLRRDLPNAMDLLVTCVEAGLGLDQALSRVAAELKAVAPLLAGELNTTFLETQAGFSRRESFRRLSERTGVDDLRQLAAVLAQTEIFGTSIARALRSHSDGMRIIRMQHAERKAAMAGVKMTFPLVLCILPCVIGVVLGPAIVSIAEHLFKQGL
jgi:tight adherence protein C